GIRFSPPMITWRSVPSGFTLTILPPKGLVPSKECTIRPIGSRRPLARPKGLALRKNRRPSAPILPAALGRFAAVACGAIAFAPRLAVPSQTYRTLRFHESSFCAKLSHNLREADIPLECRVYPTGCSHPRVGANLMNPVTLH